MKISMINMSPLALKNLKRLQKEYECVGDGLRFGLSGGGCSGYKYVIEFERSSQLDDIVYDVGDENYKINIYVSTRHIEQLKNSTIDWRDSMMESGFYIENPQAKQPCGCGKSVNFV